MGTNSFAALAGVREHGPGWRPMQGLPGLQVVSAHVRQAMPGPRPLLGWKHPRADSLNLPTYSSLADVVVEFREEIVLLLQYNSYLPTDVRRIVGSL